MGVGPSLTAELVSATPYRLRYLLTSTGQPGACVLTNEDALPAPGPNIMAGVDMRLNSQAAAQQGRLGLPLRSLLGTAVADQAEARQVLMGEAGTPPGTTDVNAVATIQARAQGVGVLAGPWTVDAQEGAAAGAAGSAGFAVLEVTPPAADAGWEAYLEIRLQNTPNL